MARAPLHKFYAMAAKIGPPELFYVVPTPSIHRECRLSKCNFLTRNGLHENDVTNQSMNIPAFYFLPELFYTCNIFEGGIIMYYVCPGGRCMKVLLLELKFLSEHSSRYQGSLNFVRVNLIRVTIALCFDNAIIVRPPPSR